MSGTSLPRISGDQQSEKRERNLCSDSRSHPLNASAFGTCKIYSKSDLTTIREERTVHLHAI